MISFYEGLSFSLYPILFHWPLGLFLYSYLKAQFSVFVPFKAARPPLTILFTSLASNACSMLKNLILFSLSQVLDCLPGTTFHSVGYIRKPLTPTTLYKCIIFLLWDFLIIWPLLPLPLSFPFLTLATALGHMSFSWKQRSYLHWFLGAFQSLHCYFQGTHTQHTNGQTPNHADLHSHP